MVQAPPSDADTIKTGHVKCQAGATEVVVWLVPGKLTEVASIKCGEKLDILLDGDLWAKIRTQDGKVGYVPQQAVGDWVGSGPSLAPAQPTPPASPSSKRSPLPRQSSSSTSPPDVARLGSLVSRWLNPNNGILERMKNDPLFALAKPTAQQVFVEAMRTRVQQTEREWKEVWRTLYESEP
jgi:hypothetical protein